MGDRRFPYEGLDVEYWEYRTEQLIKEHPLDFELIKKIVFDSWSLILNAKLGEYTIGKRT